MEKIKMFFKNRSRTLFLTVAIAIVPFFSGCGEVAPPSYKVNLEIWGTFDDASIFGEISNQYRKINPYIGDIKYRKFSQASYKQELIEALAAGQGPDIFLLNNGWLPSFKNKIEPAANSIVSEQSMKNDFPDVVVDDFVIDGKVYGAPLSVDSMALYYNKDMFNVAGITAPPKTWQEFAEDVKKLTIMNARGEIVQSGAAMGTGANINKASDLLSLLMFQNKVNLPTKAGEEAKIDEGVISGDGSVIGAGAQALGFYTSFANMGGSSYTWNSKKGNSIEEFSAGNVAMIFNYSWQNAEIKNRNPKLNFATASVPQIDGSKPANYANYVGYVVSANKNAAVASGKTKVAPISNATRVHEAWQFLGFLTLKKEGKITLYNAITKNPKDIPLKYDPALEYIKKSNQPAARRDIIELQKNDPETAHFALGNLIAKHWYQADSDIVDKIFVDMIESVNKGDLNLRDALKLGRNRIGSISK